ncbi:MULTISPECIES: oxygenase MpaB family protein [unclassified Streptomyces]|uniref:oxygenase MpaB family protein n=1 Tax=unclassified Streptomyces TaxID=2593676 RepID=UPI0004BDF9AB|nr:MULTISPECIES: oxygenase MpaB family protein [unclassified Streptomyces]
MARVSVGATTVRRIRRRAGEAVFLRVAGPDGPRNRARIHTTPGPRWFAPDRPVRRVHGDASMFVGGLAALLLQSLHPLAMAAVAAHSGYRGDPWGRLNRTSTFLAVTTFGTSSDAEAAVALVREVHARVRGRTADGVPYRADDPELLTWVHIAEVDCFLRAHQRYGRRPLDPAGCDAYLADTARVARALGADRPPESTRELALRMARYRPDLRPTAASRDTARFLLTEPPLPGAARLPYALLAAAAVDLLPPWAKSVVAEDAPTTARVPPLAARAGGHAVTRAIRWALPAAPPTSSTPPPPPA